MINDDVWCYFEKNFEYKKQRKFLTYWEGSFSLQSRELNFEGPRLVAAGPPARRASFSSASLELVAKDLGLTIALIGGPSKKFWVIFLKWVNIEFVLEFEVN